ncbi:tumor necrosis factor ligand superfamily member 13 isoform X2 [Silurus meridionalis]|uniref:tumor necrosis factor ligand superfamily member 13 isoform X2 n=1 Tax=Silurus meridionalis TaxID=175797 RepID=UPI001EECC6F1|nr:tumor necrosis factor ligand superfamily member 13 isoform X2 [Silurus meridionalis]
MKCPAVSAKHAQLCDGGVMLKWSVLVYMLGVMAALLHLHYTHRRMLTELQSVRTECSNFYCYYYCCSGMSVALTCGGSRSKRDVSSQSKPRRKRQKQRTFVHLVPASTYSYDERDSTVLSWAVGRSQGAGFQVSGESITVVTEGSYFIYSQVLYKDPTRLMGHVITKRLKGAETKLMKCLKSMPSNVSGPLNTCYTAGEDYITHNVLNSVKLTGPGVSGTELHHEVEILTWRYHPPLAHLIKEILVPVTSSHSFFYHTAVTS